MITDAILYVLGSVFDWLASWLPVGTLELPESFANFGETIGEYIGPADSFMPIHELALFLQIFFGVWAPAAAIYTVGVWILAHLPIPGV